MLRKYIGDRGFYKKVLAVSVPIMLQNGITNFVSMLDNIMVGRVGTAQMTGVAVANQILFVFMLALFGAVSGVGIFGAQFYGRGDNDGVRYCFRFKLMICGGLTLCGIGLFYFGGDWLIGRFLQGEGAPEDIAATLAAAHDYLRIMLIGLLPYAVVQCYSGTLRETGETLLPMKAGVVAVVVNLCLNYVLIFGRLGLPRLGGNGAAIATVISRFAELAVVVVWTHRHKAKNPFIVGAYRSLGVPAALAGKMAVKGMPLMLNEALWAGGIALVNQCYSVRGLDVVAASNISQTYWNVFSVVFMAIGTSIGILVGQLLGAEDYDAARDTDRKMIAFSLFTSVLMGGVYAVVAPFIPYLYNTSDGVRSLATGLMLISAATMPIHAFAHASYFTLRSGGKTLVTFLFDSCFVWCVTVPLAFVLSRATAMPILWLYFFCQAVDIIKCIIGGVLLRRGVWVKNVIQ